jgi:hypothetical protein
MESSAKKLSSLRITSLDDDDDETEVPHQPHQQAPLPLQWITRTTTMRMKKWK